MALDRVVGRLFLFCCFTLVASCSIYSLPGQEPAPVEEPPDYTVVAPGPSEPAPDPAPDRTYEDPADPNAVAAYGPLLQKADAATRKGDYEQALALLERAQRIDPDSAEVYLALAQTHAARGDRAQARATAERGLLYCRGEAQCDALRAYAR